LAVELYVKLKNVGLVSTNKSKSRDNKLPKISLPTNCYKMAA